MESIEGVLLTPLAHKFNPQGNIMHAMKAVDPGFAGFGEAYFSTIYQGEIKGWKKHLQMTMNLVVPVGKICFNIFDDRESSLTRGKYFVVELGPDMYFRLTVAPNLWVAFEGKEAPLNLLLNLANRMHDPSEAINQALENIPFLKENLS